MSEPSDPRAYEELLGSPAPQGFDYLVSNEQMSTIEYLREGKSKEQADLAVLEFYGIQPNSRLHVMYQPLPVYFGPGYFIHISG